MPSEGSVTSTDEPRILERSQHRLSRKHVDHGAIKVLYRLNHKGHKAYLVGGGVRDLLLGGEPKDFDVATDATPMQVRKLFRNSRIIGRRFRLVHVMFREGIVEVSTFRAKPDPNEQRVQDDELLITSDNTWGTPREDAFRRDFTINALFYDISDFSIIDYVGGLEDLENETIRVIGNPDVRFGEDPVRMLRACEFAGRLGFEIDEVTQQAIFRHRHEIEKASPARLTEELLQLLRSGAAGPTAQWMIDLGLLELLLPEVHRGLVEPAQSADFSSVLLALDKATQEGAGFSDRVLLGTLVAPIVVEERYVRETQRGRGVPRAELQRIAEDAVAGLAHRFALSNLKTQQVLHTMESFQRLCEPMPSEREARRLASKASFAAALEVFGLLVEATGGEGQEVFEEWREVARTARRSGGGRERGRPRGRRRRGGRRRRRRS